MDGSGVSRHGPGRLRIVSGAKRGRWIHVPAVEGVRPTSDMVREAVFDVLGSVNGLDVVDLFAGTGAMGLEALSRGARSCVFVEGDPKVAKVLRENVGSLGYEGVSQVVSKDYRRAVEAMQKGGHQCDLLFLDPPYRILAEVEVQLAPSISGLMSAAGVIVIEGPRLSKVTFGQDPVFDRHYGDTRIIMVRVKE